MLTLLTCGEVAVVVDGDETACFVSVAIGVTLAVRCLQESLRGVVGGVPIEG